MILAFDSSTPWLGVVLVEGDNVLFRAVHYTRTGHSLLLMKYLETISAYFDLRGNLECVLIGLGPGSFTGVKVGSMIAKGLAYAFHVPLGGFSTLEVLASQARRFHSALSFEVIVPVVFHRKEEVFWSEFLVSSTEHSATLQVGPLEELIAQYRGRKDILIVTPWESLCREFQRADLTCLDSPLAIPDAFELVVLARKENGTGSFENIFTVLPFYGSRVFERERLR